MPRPARPPSRRLAAGPIVAVLVLLAVVLVAAAGPSRSTPRGSAGPPSTIAPPSGSTAPSTTIRTGLGSISTTPPVPIPTTAPPTPPSTDGEPVSRDIPTGTEAPADAVAPPPWAASVTTTEAGSVSTDLGCAADTTADSLAAFFAERAGPLLGMDYQHTYPLGGDRTLWLFQDAFVDQPGAATTLGQATFVHNVALVQTGVCFTLFHGGTPDAPASFERGTGEQTRSTWFWPLGGELSGDQLSVFWAQMRKDATNPAPGNGLGWHPESTWLAVYDARTLARLDFRPAPAAGVTPIFGTAVASDDQYTYLFGNTFEQNLDREGGFLAGPHSATQTFLARVELGALDSDPAYWTGDGWSVDRDDAQPILQRGWVEDPLQPRWLNGQWVAVSKLDGYWGDTLTIDVAPNAWGPWTTIARQALPGDSALTNTYHAQLLPALDASGQLVVSYSRNARNMTRDASPHPERYRIAFRTVAFPRG